MRQLTKRPFNIFPSTMESNRIGVYQLQRYDGATLRLHDVNLGERDESSEKPLQLLCTGLSGPPIEKFYAFISVHFTGRPGRRGFSSVVTYIFFSLFFPKCVFNSGFNDRS